MPIPNYTYTVHTYALINYPFYTSNTFKYAVDTGSSFETCFLLGQAQDRGNEL